MTDEEKINMHYPRTAVATTYRKDVALNTNPHYTDERFNTAQTVFDKPSKSDYGHKDLSYDYSDRLYQWDYEKAKHASEVASATDAKLRSARWYEAYLSAYFDRPIEIIHILAGVNVSNGYAYAVFGYRDATEGRADTDAGPEGR